MTTPITGAISASQVQSELGLTGAISFGASLVRQLSNQTTGLVSIGNARAAKYVNSTITNQNAFVNFFSSPAIATAFKILIGTSGVIGATTGNTALVIGQFPTGSSITLNNYGQIGGYGGAGGTPTGGVGGDAIYASYANQTVVINNQAGAFIRGGGGGGGKGGNGGTGGTGGGGSYSSVSSLGASSQLGTSCNKSCEYQFGSGAYCSSAGGCYQYSDGSYLFSRCQAPLTCQRNVTVNTNGGAGGGGGAGGNGGRGQGYDGANAGGSTGSGGSAGSAGGINAGAGGTGGTGGIGGTGGTWGNAGAGGATGNTGATGANGNRTAGLAGSAGAGGSGGGSAGRYLVKGANSVTLNNSGTIAGGLA